MGELEYNPTTVFSLHEFVLVPAFNRPSSLPNPLYLVAIVVATISSLSTTRGTLFGTTCQPFGSVGTAVDGFAITLDRELIHAAFLGFVDL